MNIQEELLKKRRVFLAEMIKLQKKILSKETTYIAPEIVIRMDLALDDVNWVQKVNEMVRQAGHLELGTFFYLCVRNDKHLLWSQKQWVDEIFEAIINEQHLSYGCLWRCKAIMEINVQIKSF